MTTSPIAPVPAAPTSPTTPPAPAPAPAPAPGTTTTVTPSGLVVVHNGLTTVSAGSQLVIPSGPLTGDAALEAAKAAYAELAGRVGTPAADIVQGGQVSLAQQVRNDELREQAIAALLAGDVDRAAELISQQR